MKICAITNTYNESHNLPVWIEYYGNQLGLKNCIVFDHGSNDDSLEKASGASIINLPRGEFNDLRRAKAISRLVGSLVCYYDIVIYTDADEIIIPDPRVYGSLHDFFSKTDGRSYTCIGLNLIHHVYEESPLRHGIPILKQRKYCQFSSPMCKTLATRDEIRWGGGFHSANVAPEFCDLFLFHTHNADMGEALRRLAITRDLVWADPGAGLHQRQSNKNLLDLFHSYASWKTSEDFSQIENYKAETLAGVVRSENDGLFYIPMTVQPQVLYRVPDWFGAPF